jgi:hypothetical protein
MPFQTAVQVTIHFLNVINPGSTIENFEYGGPIYRLGNGPYDHTIL